MSAERKPSIDDLSRALARGASCPSPQRFVMDEWRRLSDPERQRIERHVEHCASCAAERDLARAYDPTSRGKNDDRDETYVVERLERSSVTRAGDHAPRHANARGSRRWALAASVAAIAILGAIAWLWVPVVPPLPEPGAPTVVRGASLTLLAPVGEVPVTPRELRWSPVDGAREYRVVIERIDGSVLWEATSPAETIDVPVGPVATMTPAVTYRWSVEARDETGRPVARSVMQNFRIGRTE